MKRLIIVLLGLIALIDVKMGPEERLPGSALATEALGRVERVSSEVVRQPVAIPSDGELLRGWLYLPSSRPPGARLAAIVTANALSAIKEINLPEYAERFAAAVPLLSSIIGTGERVPASHASTSRRWNSART
jgi:hypothetical protein